MRAIVVGSIHLDWTLRVPRMPAPGETVLAEDRTWSPGGKGANQAVALARFGAEVAMVGAVGLDADGSRALDGLRSAGVDVQAVRRGNERPTGVAVVTVDERGENHIVVAAGASGALAPADVTAAEAAIERADVLLVQLEIPLETVGAAVAAAHAAGVPVVLNAAPARPLPDALLGPVAVLVANEHEALALADSTAGAGDGAADRAAAAARALQARGPAAVVVTRSAEGAFVADADGLDEVAAHAVDVVDSTGAGDAFAAAIAVGVATGRPVRESARLAAAAAAIAVGRPGAQSAPTLAETEAFLSERD